MRLADLMERRSPVDAKMHFDVSQRLFRSIGDFWGSARTLVGLGFGEAMENQLVAAARSVRREPPLPN